jgi:hypothetical protein
VSFETQLHVHALERERRIIASFSSGAVRPLSPATLERMPGLGHDGYLPLDEAARAMGRSREQTLDLASRGVLEAYDDGSGVRVKPAIVSMLLVGAPRPIPTRGGTPAAERVETTASEQTAPRARGQRGRRRKLAEADAA